MTHAFSIRGVVGLLSAATLVLTTSAWGSPHTSAQALVDPVLSEQMSTAEAPLTVFVHGVTADIANQAVEESGLELIESFDKVAVAVGYGSKIEIMRAASRPGITYLEADKPINFMMTTSHQATRGQAALDGFTDGTNSSGPVDGSGVTIAIVDTGIDGTHPMFQQSGSSKVVKNLRLGCALLTACTGPDGDTNDNLWLDTGPLNNTDSPTGGHGTHVAGTAAGVAVTTSDGKNLHGAAPDAKLVGLSVGTLLSLYGTNSGLNWVLEHHAAPCGVPSSACPPIKVVNNSWGSAGGAHDPNSTTARIVNKLVAEGVVVVFSAGNGDTLNNGGDGSDNRVNPHAQNPTPGVIGVANYDDENTGTRNGSLDSSSSRGLSGTPATYPDISAPGSSITSACRPHLPICSSLNNDPNYGTISGTSMAAPHISGIVAQALQASPALTPAEIEDLLEDNAFKFTAGAAYEADPANADNTTSFDKGHGLVDVKAAAAELRGVTIPSETPLPTVNFSCVAGGAMAEDPEGDTYVVKFIPTNTDVPPYDTNLDIREGRLSWDGSTLTASIRVQDLTGGLSPTAPELSYNFNFYRGDIRYFVEATRSVDGDHFAFGRWTMVSTPVTTQGARLVDGEATGGFDAATDTITMSLSNAEFTAAGNAPLATDEVLTGVTFASRRPTRTPVTTVGLTTDSTDELCHFKLGTGPISPPPPPPPPPPPAPDGTISPTNPTYAWSEEVSTDVVLPFTGTNASGCDGEISNDACASQRIEVTLATNITNTLDFQVTGDAFHTFYMYVYAPDGSLFGSGDGGDFADSTRVKKAATLSGVYTVVVRASATLDGEYNGFVELTTSSGGGGGGEYDSELNSTNPSSSWSGGPTTGAFLDSYTCGDPTDGLEVHRINITVPAGGSTLNIELEADLPDVNDFDFYVCDPSSAELDHSANGGSVESINAPVSVSGIYTVVLVPWLTFGANWSLTAQLL